MDREDEGGKQNSEKWGQSSVLCLIIYREYVALSNYTNLQVRGGYDDDLDIWTINDAKRMRNVIDDMRE